jgi:hypothetical protein
MSVICRPVTRLSEAGASPIRLFTISIMTSGTDFETSLSGEANHVQVVKTLTGSLHRSAESRENVFTPFFQLKIQNHLSLFPVFYKCKFLPYKKSKIINSTGNSHAVSYHGTIPARRSLDCRELTRPGVFYVVWPLTMIGGVRNLIFSVVNGGRLR